MSDTERQFRILVIAAHLAWGQEHPFPVQQIINGHVVQARYAVRPFHDPAPWLTVTIDGVSVPVTRLDNQALLAQLAPKAGI